MAISINSPASSYLFVPCDRLDRLAKALATAADVVVIDLEDAVAPEAKFRARQALMTAQFPPDRIMVRINGFNTEWHAHDIDVVCSIGVRAVMLPKAEDANEIESIASRLGAGVSITALVESAKGIWQALEVARAPGVARLAFGSLDFAQDTGTSLDSQALLYARSRLVLASRVANLPPPIDGVTTTINEAATLERDVQQAKMIGFGAKLCIHPNQIDTVNRGFVPLPEELSWARAVLAAAEDSGGAAVMLEGRMIDIPVVKHAKRIVERAERQARQ